MFTPVPLSPDAGQPEQPPRLALVPDCGQAREQVGQLDALLQEEFQALRAQAFERLEALQVTKMALLEALQSTSEEVAALPEKPEQWPAVIDALRDCQQSWHRNQALVTRQLDVVRNALRSLQLADPSASVDLYDRQGQTSRRFGARLYTEA